MTNPAKTSIHSRSANRPESKSGDPLATPSVDRGLPFVWRVATVWTNVADLAKEGDGQLCYWRRAPLTGNVASTSGGRDVNFSDIEAQ